MQRKLIAQGLGGITVNLPKKWIDAHHLSKGDEVEIGDSDGKLIISPTSRKQKREVTIKLVGMEESLIRILIGNTYRLGYDSIKVEFEEERQFQILNEVIQKRIIGFEIVRKEAKSCLVENVTEPDEDQFENIIQKLFLNIDVLIESVEKLCSSENVKLGEDLDELEDRILKYDNFCRRILLKQRFDPKSSLYLAFITMVIHAQRELYYLAKAVGKGAKCSPETLKIVGNVGEMNRKIQEAYIKKNTSVLELINKKGRDIIYKQGYGLLEKKKGKESIILYHLLACVRDIYQAVSPLAGMLL